MAVDVRYRDRDGDGDGDGDDDPAAGGLRCPSEAGFVANADDCDDQASWVGPGPEEFRDADDDGYGDPATSAFQCMPLAGYVATAGDCDDTSAAIHPGVEDIGEDGIDQNCSGADAHFLGWECATAGGGNGAIVAMIAAVLGVRRRRK